MFELLFQYPARIFAKGELVFLAGAPVWMLGAAILAALAGLFLLSLRASSGRFPTARRLTLWGIRGALVTLLLVMLWQPALRVSSLKPQQNIVAVVIDDSKSMAVVDGSERRIDAVRKTLGNGLLDGLRDRYQVRLYRAGETLTRIPNLDQVTAAGPATRLGSTLKQAVAESSTLPVGAIVLLSDGADNSGGIDLASLDEIRRRRIPVHTVGFGREQMSRDAELTQVELPARGIRGAKLAAQIQLRQRGFAGGKARLVARADGKVLASREITLAGDGVSQTETLMVAGGEPGARTVEFALDGLTGEENANNNSLRRLVTIEPSKPRVLYIEGEPRWEYKFLRRAMEEDSSIELVSILRTTQNKIYRQGIANPSELEAGFPVKMEDLFGFQGLIIGGVEASYFTPNQQEAIKLFADRRGGGVLFLAGRTGLADGGYASSPFAEILPVTLPDRKNTFKRDPANLQLTDAGRESAITRLEDSIDKNAERWKKLPHLANYQEVGQAKPGAVVLVESLPTSKGRFPLLATQNFGRGRVGVFASGGTWRWRMQLELKDQTHETFWRQLLRWTVAESPGLVSATTPRQVLSDEKELLIRADVRDKTYQPVRDAVVEARILGPNGLAATVPLAPEPMSDGVYTASWTADPAGSYLVELAARRGSEEVGRDVFNFRREDGVAENFGVEQNRELLTKLAAETGGNYYSPSNASKLINEISFSEAGLTIRENRDLWNMPIVFLLILGLIAAEWLLRRRWGAI
jgi:uncharacterized membrane protein